MIDDKIESGSEIAEGLPPVLPTRDDRVEAAEQDLRVSEPSAMQVFFAWEKLRIVYNLILFAAGLYLESAMRGGGHSIGQVLMFFLVINMGYCVGPVAEGYLCWFLVHRGIARLLAFWGWTVLSLVLVFSWR